MSVHRFPGLSSRLMRTSIVVIALLAAMQFAHRILGTPYAGMQHPVLEAQQTAASWPTPIDPQKVQDQYQMTWADYHPIPGVNWADPSKVPSKKQFKMALVAIDFTDQPFVVTLPKYSDLFGNPQIDPVKRDAVPQFYSDFYNTPGTINHGQTINGYWMEQSRGQIGIAKMDAYGPYLMPKKLFQYGLREFGQEGAVPTGYTVDGNMERDADSLWARAVNDTAIKRKYDIIFRVYAAYDETGVWQEFGEMKFLNKDAIPKEWGNPDTTKARWIVTRYVPWTSWKAGQMQWGISSLRQGENSGTITHEIVHFAFSVGDNNNNPYVTPYRRVGSGPWDIMDRGSFNGPGGPHRRWVVPAAEGAAMPAGLMLRSKVRFGFLSEASVLNINRDALAKTGLAVGVMVPRAVEAGPGQLSGMVVNFDSLQPLKASTGRRPTGARERPSLDKTPVDDMNTNPLSAGVPDYDNYTVEAVQRLGYDSFTPDNGILIAKNKVEENSRQECGRTYNCFTWVIDAHPEDINLVDFKRPDGTPVMRTVADYRQLNDALFHAGTNSGSLAEWEDTPNRLHFYVIDMKTDPRGVRLYTVGVRSLDGSGSQARGVALMQAPAQRLVGGNATCSFSLRNTGSAAGITASSADTRQFYNQDIYRLSVSVAGAGWQAALPNGFAAAAFGQAQSIPVLVRRAGTGAASGTMTLKAISESDPTRQATATCVVSG